MQKDLFLEMVLSSPEESKLCTQRVQTSPSLRRDLICFHCDFHHVDTVDAREVGPGQFTVVSIKLLQRNFHTV